MKELNGHFSKDIQRANKHKEKILVIMRHQGNANQNYKMPFHKQWKAKIKKNKCQQG